ncbi:hypothetical protein C0991_007978 [Blastosporella zonata]|nr:hypothetical protein C0991_007978 [Blastosporella zonata]
MSFCRRLLFSVHKPNFPRQQLATRYGHGVYNATTRTPTTGHRVRSLGGLYAPDTAHTTSPPVALSPLHISKRALSTTNRRAKRGEGHLTPSEYQTKRAGDASSVANLPPSSYLGVYHAAVESDMPGLAETVVSDILDAYEGPRTTRVKMLEDILSQDLWSLKCETVLRILEHLKESSPDVLHALLTLNSGTIARRMLDTTEICDTDRPFLRLLHPSLLKHLKTMTSPRKLKSATFKPPFLIYASFTAIHKLLAMSFEQHALDIFQSLALTGYVPTEALHNVDNSSGNTALIVAMAVIRSCLHWNWRVLAATFMTDLIIKHPSSKAIIDLNIDTIYALLNTHPTQRDIRACGHLIRRIHQHSPVPDSVIRLFYNCAVAADAKEEAEDLYAFTRSYRMDNSYRYPPPHDTALPWLLDHLGTGSSQTHLARILAMEAVEDNLWIPTPYRAQFIARIASLGYATQARALWERHATGKDGVLVTANAALMIRMVSLCWNLHKNTLGKANAIRCEEGKEEELQRLQTIADEAAAFTERVRLEFAFHHAPLAKAPHWQLTSLARACFIVGRISEGYQSLRYLLNRRETPDLYDANVALSAVAQLSPRLAADMIERMTDLGLRPDGVSFGTALHYAVIQGDREVVDKMIERIRNLDDAHISIKTLTSLVHASLALGGHGSCEDIRRTLANILHLIKSFPDMNMSSQTQTAKALVYAALRAKDGVIAYNFWKLMLRKGAEWDDIEQQRLRHSIAWLIQRDDFPRPEDRAAMLMQLGKRRMVS